MTDKIPPPDGTPSDESQSKPDPGPLIYRSRELFQGRREIFIEHNDAVYKLRVTSNGRLILTK